jgi:hypothetical protein
LTGENITVKRRLEIFERFKEEFEETNEIPKEKHLVVSTDRTRKEALSETLHKIIGLQLCSAQSVSL